MQTDGVEVAAGPGSEADGEPEAPGEAPEREEEQRGEEQQQEAPVRRRQPENEVSEVEIPNVGRIMVRADADGYNEEVSPRLPSSPVQLLISHHLGLQIWTEQKQTCPFSF